MEQQIKVLVVAEGITPILMEVVEVEVLVLSVVVQMVQIVEMEEMELPQQ